MKTGRPSVLTQEQKARILELHTKGNFYIAIAKELGLNHGTVRYWLTKCGKNPVKSDLHV